MARRYKPELQHGEICCEIEKEHHRSKFDPSQFDDTVTQFRIYINKVFANVRQKLGRPKKDKMFQIDTNAVIWRILMAVVLLGKE